MTSARAPIDLSRVQAGLASVLDVDAIVVLDRVGSTSTALRDLLASREWAGPVLLTTEHQQAGRGRAGHGWQTPAGAALTLSLAFHPARVRRSWGWLPLLSGLGVVRALERRTGLRPAIKWPNDVLLPADHPLPGWGAYRKTTGILAETTGSDVVIVGIGINVDQNPAELPVPHAGSLRTAGVVGVDRTGLLIELVREVLALAASPRDPAAEDEVRARCITVGAEITAELPGGDQLSGIAQGIDAEGALLVRTPAGAVHTLTAGDLYHVRLHGELGSVE